MIPSHMIPTPAMTWAGSTKSQSGKATFFAGTPSAVEVPMPSFELAHKLQRAIEANIRAAKHTTASDELAATLERRLGVKKVARHLLDPIDLQNAIQEETTK